MYVEEGKEANKHAGKKNLAKKILEKTGHNAWCSLKYSIAIVDTERMGFDREQFILDFGIEMFNKYYRKLPSTTWEVSEL